jgi:Zinc-binding domain
VLSELAYSLTRPTNMSSRKPKTENRWSIAFHKDVSRLLKDDGLFFDYHEVDEDAKQSESYDTNIMGRFTCRNSACRSNGWSRYRIAITIRMYPEKRYNARVYHQPCKSCNKLNRPFLDESYTERVAYRLKNWSGIRVDLPSYSGESKGPHNGHLCEGCKAGHCTA